MTLCDTGPIIALIDADDPNHSRCSDALRSLPPVPLITTWPCFIEAMYLLGRAGGHVAQEELWTYIADGLVLLHPIEMQAIERMRLLMREYRDTPMDLADASLVVAAQDLAIDRIFTLDRHFHAYRIERDRAFHIVP